MCEEHEDAGIGRYTELAYLVEMSVVVREEEAVLAVSVLEGIAHDLGAGVEAELVVDAAKVGIDWPGTVSGLCRDEDRQKSGGGTGPWAPTMSQSRGRTHHRGGGRDARRKLDAQPVRP